MKTKVPLILASGSPRRKLLLESCGLTFEVRKYDFNEDNPVGLYRHELARHLARSKSVQCGEDAEKNVVLTADTIVCLGDDVLGKPKDDADAEKMLTTLSGRVHEVITGICLSHAGQFKEDSVSTRVTFGKLKPEMIRYYVKHFQPFDKAGGYGIQEWIGMVGIEKIEGDYYNVVGLPVKNTLEALDWLVGIDYAK